LFIEKLTGKKSQGKENSGKNVKQSPGSSSGFSREDDHGDHKKNKSGRQEKVKKSESSEIDEEYGDDNFERDAPKEKMINRNVEPEKPKIPEEIEKVPEKTMPKKEPEKVEPPKNKGNLLILLI